MNRFATILNAWILLSALCVAPPPTATAEPPVAVDEDAVKALEAALEEAGVMQQLPQQEVNDLKAKDAETAEVPPSTAPSPTPMLQTDEAPKSKPETPSAVPSSKPIWYIELSTHTDRLDAEVEASAFNYRRLGEEAPLVRLNPAESFSVLVGPFEKRAMADQKLSVLELDSLAGDNPRIVDLNHFE
ncbi:MAG: hypothetical protein GX589_10615 [Deltaproteobacteria bacterium]|nr:hypothetical protein [Deltaproteobacteria bacterium]